MPLPSMSNWLRRSIAHDRRGTIRWQPLACPRRARLGLELLEDRILPTVTWTNVNGGDWDTGSNWSTGTVPGSGDDVIINLSGITITHNQSATDAIKSLTSADPLTVSNGSLTIAGNATFSANLNLSGGTLSVGGTLQVAAGATLTVQGGTLTNATIATGTHAIFTEQGGTLSGVTADSNLDLATNNGANVTIANGLTLSNTTVYLGNAAGSSYGRMYFDNTATLGGTGTVVFGKYGSSNALYETGYGATLTLGGNITLRGSSGTLGGSYSNDTIVNQGTISADDSGGAVPGFVYDSAFSGGSSWAVNTAANIDVSAVANAPPATVYQTARIGNGFSYALANLTPAASYTVALDFAEIQGATAGQRQFNVSINGSKVLSNFDITSTAGALNKAVVESFTATADSTGTITIKFADGNNYALVNGIELEDSSGNVVQAINCGEEPGGTLTINLGSVQNQGTLAVSNGEALNISGVSGNLGTATLAGSGSQLTLSGSNYVINSGLTATAGETLSLRGTWSNAAGSTISATGATLNLGDQSNSSTNAWSNAGTIAATNSTVNLGGLFTLAQLGTFNRSGGTVNLVGTLDNTNTTLSLNRVTGSWNLTGGELKKGTYTDSDGAALVMTNSGGVLDGVTANAGFDLASKSGANVTILDGMTLGTDAVVSLGNAAGSTYGTLYFDGTETLGGTGSVLFGKSSSNRIYESNYGDTLTIGPNVTVRGSSGTLTGNYTNNTIVNQGMIAADDSGGIVPGFVYDTGFSGSGYTTATAGYIDTSALTNAPPAALFQTARYGYNFSYALANLTPAASYSVVLQFAEIQGQTLGQRTFNVGINGTQVLSNFDIAAAAGALNKAVAQSFSAIADSSGTIHIAFSAGNNWALVNGITLQDSSGNTVQAIDCGNEAGGTITVNPGTFTTTGTLLAGTAGTLAVRAQTLNDPGTLQADRGGLIQLTGSAIFSPTTQINVQVAGTTAGAYGQIAISGSAALNGTLNVQPATGMTLNTGDTVNVMSFASHTDNFTNVTGTSVGRYVFFTETVSSTAVTLTAAAQAEDLAAGSVTFPASGTAGQNAAITYTVNNLSNVPVSGDWFDSLYLTPDSTLDANAVLLTRVERTTPVAANGSYQEQLNVPLPGVLPGTYHVALFVDSRGLLQDADRSNNLLISTGTVQVAVPTLTLGSPLSTTIAAGQSLYYGIDIPAGHDIAFSAVSPVPGGAEVYVRYGAVPSTSKYDQFAFDATGQDQEVDISGATQGTYYLLVAGQPAAATGSALTLSVADVPFSLRSISVATAGTGDPFTETLKGFQFTPQTTASLISSTGSSLPAESVTYMDRNTLYATFEVPLFDDGIYSVQAQQGSATSTLANAITAATQPNSAQATLSMSAPQYVRSTSYGTITVSYANETNHDIPAPLLNVTATNALVRLPDQPTFLSNKVEFLGINTTGPAGVLPPGARGQMTIYFEADIPAGAVVPAGQPVGGGLPLPPVLSFNVYPSLDYYNIGDAGQTQFDMDWASVKDAFRPSTIDTDAWDAIWSNFLTSVGSNVAQFHTRLAIDANALSQVGDYQYDVANLISFELARANDALPLGMLAHAVDVSSPAPGMALAFNRDFLQPISGRYLLGPLGRGWVDNWEVTATMDGQGNVTILDAGQYRFFTHNADGSYRAEPGDDGHLVLSNGTYTLTEQDGTQWAFDKGSNIAKVADANGNTITLGYTAGRLTSLKSSDGQCLTLAYNAAGRIQAITDAAGSITTYTYDTSGQYLLRVSGPQGTTAYHYVSGQSATQNNALASIAFADGAHEYFRYDAQGRLVGSMHDGNTEPLQYDYTSPAGVTTTDAAGAKTTLLFNTLGSLVLAVDALGHTVHAQYDSAQHLTQLTTAAGTKYRYSYDTNGNLVRVIDPLGHTTAMTYAGTAHLLASIADGNGNTTQYAYNGAGNLISSTSADGSETTVSYNNVGLPASTMDARGQATSYQYNTAGQLTKETFADGTSDTYTYDAEGNLTSTTDATGTTTYSYNSARQLTSIIYSSGKTLDYTYNTGGQLIKIVDAASGYTVGYNYTLAGKLQSLTDANGTALVTYKYDVVGRLADQDNANGTYSTYGYDTLGNLLHLINYGPGGAVQSRFDYTYDALNERRSEATRDGTWTYSYDGAGQLSHAVFASTNPAVPNQDLLYVYDAAGNRIKTLFNGVTTNYAVNNRNEYTTVGGTTYRYDADGNLAAQSDSSGTTTFTYNALNQLIKVVTPTDTWTYQYNALGERIGAVHDGQAVTYVLDPTGLGNVIAAYDASGNLVANYAYGIGLVSRTDAQGTDYYQFDAVGSAAGLTQSDGSLVQSYRYLPFGDGVTATGSVANPFQFIGRLGVQTDGTGLNDMRMRAYQPSTGRFIAMDPLRLLAPNFYAYARNQPTGLVDPQGQCSLADIASSIGGEAFEEATAQWTAQHPVAGAIVTGVVEGVINGIAGAVVASAGGPLTVAGGFVVGFGLGFVGGVTGLPTSFCDLVIKTLLQPPEPPRSPPVPYGSQPADT